ncbi:MAG: hypothetical protein ACJ8AF_04135 [Gemmatimonadaceae bacterium]|jgi:hypothetical protein
MRSYYQKRCCLIQNLWVSAAFLFVLVAAVSAPRANGQMAAGTANDNQWHWDLSLPAWGPAIDGTISFSGIPPQKVEASLSDIVKNLNFALIGQAEGRRNHLGFGSNLLYMSLEADVPTSGPILGQTNPRANVKALIAEGFGFYRLTTSGSEPYNQSFADLILGARYVGMQAQIKGDAASSSKRTFNFVDGLAGVRGYAGLGKTWGLRGRVDVATFGSDVTWNLEGSLAWRASQRWTIDGGYRSLDIDYDKGQGTDRKILNLKIFGPVITFRFVS